MIQSGLKRMIGILISGFEISVHVSQNCSKKVQKIIDTVLALWDSRFTHGNI
jgi:hypothetical protein